MCLCILLVAVSSTYVHSKPTYNLHTVKPPTTLLVVRQAHDVHGLSGVLILIGIVHSRHRDIAVAHEGVAARVLEQELSCTHTHTHTHTQGRRKCDRVRGSKSMDTTQCKISRPKVCIAIIVHVGKAHTSLLSHRLHHYDRAILSHTTMWGGN